MQLTDADVQEIIRLLDASDYHELEIETERLRLVLKRDPDGQAGWSQQRETRQHAERLETPTTAPVPAGTAEERLSRQAEDQADDGLVAIRSPMVGVFYRAPRPGAEPFVQPGSPVGPDTVVAIIEVMKLMNSVAAGADGEVVEILAENGHLVQKGQCLMRVRPAPGPGGRPPE